MAAGRRPLTQEGLDIVAHGLHAARDLGLGRGDDVAIVVLGDGQQTVHGLQLLPVQAHGGGDGRVGLAAQTHVAHVGAHSGQAPQHQLHRVGLTGREQARQVLQRDAHLGDGRQQHLVVLPVQPGGRHLVDDRGERRDVPDHRHGAVLGVQGQGHLVGVDEVPDGGGLGRLDPVVRHALGARPGHDLGVVGVEQDLALRHVQVLRVLDGSGLRDTIGVVEEDAQVAQAAHAGLRAHGGLADLQTRVAQGALLGLAGGVVEVDLLVGAGRHAHAPAAAGVLVHQDDAVLGALVHGARRAGGHAGGVEAVLADARQVEHEGRLDVGAHLGAHGLDDRVLLEGLHGAAQVVVPVGTPLDGGHVLAGQLALGARHRQGRRVLGGREQLVVLVGPRLVVVLDRGHLRIGEDVDQAAQAPARAGTQASRGGALPAAAPGVLVLPSLGVADTGAGLDVVEPHVLGALAVGPGLLAGH